MTLDRPVAPNPYDLLPAVPAFEVDQRRRRRRPAAGRRPGRGHGNTSPQLSWSGFPDDTKSFVVTCFDPDAPTPVGLLALGAVRHPGRGHLAGHRCRRRRRREAAARGVHVPQRRRLEGLHGRRSPGGRPGAPLLLRRARGPEETLGVDSDATPAVVSFNLAFKTAARAIIHGTYQH